MKRIWAGLMVFCMIPGIFGAAGAETDRARESFDPAEQVQVLELPAPEGGSLAEIPIDQDSRETAIPPHEECYLYPEIPEDGRDSGTASGYADPSITVNIGRGRIYETDFVYARVKIASPTQFRAMLASPITSKNTIPGSNLAKRVNAVIAINGDFCGGEDHTQGAIMRQGELLRLRCDQQFDILVVDRNGDFKILRDASNDDVTAVQDQAVNIFTFGPALIIDGEPQYGKRMGLMGTHRPAQRMAIAQTGKLEYLLITCEGPEDPGSKGLTIDQFVDLLSSFSDVQNAYNLDGGSSSTLVFRKNGKNWEKINAPRNGKIRPLKDIIFFADAWVPESQEETE